MSWPSKSLCAGAVSGRWWRVAVGVGCRAGIVTGVDVVVNVEVSGEIVDATIDGRECL